MRRTTWISRLRDWLARLASRDPLRTRCAVCGRPFVATPDSFVEVGVDVAGEAPDEEPTPEERAEVVALFRGLGFDRDTATALADAKPGDRIPTGAQAWCGGCLAKLNTEH